MTLERPSLGRLATGRSASRTLVTAIALLFSISTFAEGESCTDISQCVENEYCNLAFGTCLGSAPQGECRFVNPLAGCTHLWMPVCGCDLLTYSNACFADIAYVSMLYLGECRICVGGNDDCQASEVCRATQGGCDAFDGVCVPLSVECSANCHQACGCDGKTYDNDCTVALAGLSVAHSGLCENPGDGLVTGVVFDDQGWLIWSAENNASHYNVYREVVTGSISGEGNICYLPGVTTTSIDLLDRPQSGELWLLQVASVVAEGQEGPLGRQTNCGDRFITASCP